MFPFINLVFLWAYRVMASIRTMGSSIDYQCIVIMRFDGYVFHFRPRDVAIEVVEAVVFFEIKARDEAIHKAVVVGEMPVKFVDVVNDRAEVVVDTSTITSRKSKLTKR